MSLLFKNQEFDSFDEFLKCRKEYEKKNLVTLVIDTSSTVQNINKKLSACGRTDLYKPSLKYQNIKFVCKHGGRKRIGTGTGARKIQSTFKLDCPAFVHLIADKTKLRINDINECHENHELTQENFDILPENRKLPEEAIEKVRLLFSGGVKPAVVRLLLRNTSSSGYITPRDFSNLKQKWKAEAQGHATEDELLIEALSNILDEDPGAHIFIGKETKEKDSDDDDCVDDPADDDKASEEENLKYIFIQTSKMRENVDKFGKVILMDHTYKINKNRMPLCVMTVTDGAGNTRSAGYAFVVNEHLTTVTDVLRSFRKAIGEEAANRVQTIVVDKDPSEIAAIAEVFPNAQIQLCSFHVSKTFKEKASKESKETKEILKKMKHTIFDAEFQQLVEELKVAASSEFFEYFDKSWLNCRQAWCDKDKKTSMNYGNTTTNRVENLNGKMKRILNINSTLAEAVQGLLELVKNKEEDVFFNSVQDNLKQTYLTKSSDKYIQSMLSDLTKYAAKLLIWEYQAEVTQEEIEHYDANDQSCECLHVWSYNLPCRHIFQERRKSGIPVYATEELDKMWLKSFYTPTQANCQLSDGQGQVIVRSIPALKAKTVTEKYKLANVTAQELCNIMAESGSRQFEERLCVLKDLVKIWALGGEALVSQKGQTIDETGHNRVLLPPQASSSMTEQQTDDSEMVELIAIQGRSLSQPIDTLQAIEIQHPDQGAECPADTENLSTEIQTPFSQENILDESKNKLSESQETPVQQPDSENCSEERTEERFEQLSKSQESVEQPSGDSEIVTNDYMLPSANDSNETLQQQSSTIQVLLVQQLSGPTSDDIMRTPSSPSHSLPKKDLLNDSFGSWGEYSHLMDDEDEESMVEVLNQAENQKDDDGNVNPQQKHNDHDEGNLNLMYLRDLIEAEESQDERAPNCLCGIPSVRRNFKTNPNRQFWGCSNYFNPDGSKKCKFHRFMKSKVSKVKEAMDGVKIPATVKTKGRPRGSGKTSYLKHFQGSQDSLKKPAGACITPFQLAAHKSKSRQEKGEKISDCDVKQNKDGTYSVTSQTNKTKKYIVTDSSCTCPDTEPVCKHMVKVRQILQKGTEVTTTHAKTIGTAHAIVESQNAACSICSSGEPSHHCQVCRKKVHAIEPCSVPPQGLEEGYGKARICKLCQDKPVRGLKRKMEQRQDLDKIDVFPDASQPSQASQGTRKSVRDVKRKVVFTPSKY